MHLVKLDLFRVLVRRLPVGMRRLVNVYTLHGSRQYRLVTWIWLHISPKTDDFEGSNL